ncbi:hypothetical protein KBD87_02915 [Candidatus Saccharibacteria bacterium]|nr:hypothetical protein [Candidatus Saccharibacteria bacterium]
MSNRIRQNGSAHAIAIICLVLALIAALGWIFWQNVMSKDASSKRTTKSAVLKDVAGTNVDLSTSSKIIATTSLQQNYAMTYPSSWVGKQGAPRNDKETKAEKITVTSPDGNITVGVESYEKGGGFGGACDSTLTYALVPKKVKGINGLYLNAAVFSDKSAVTYAAIGISKVAMPKECGYLDIFENNQSGATIAWLESKKPYTRSISSSGEGTYGTFEQYVAFFETPDFKTAQDILLSLEYTK